MITEITRNEAQRTERTRTSKSIVRGEGRLSRITFGVGSARRNVTNVVGASPESIEWNFPQDAK